MSSSVITTSEKNLLVKRLLQHLTSVISVETTKVGDRIVSLYRLTDNDSALNATNLQTVPMMCYSIGYLVVIIDSIDKKKEKLETLSIIKSTLKELMSVGVFNTSFDSSMVSSYLDFYLRDQLHVMLEEEQILAIISLLTEFLNNISLL